jgi:hypothetical protein
MAATTLRTALATTVSLADPSKNFEYLTQFGVRTGGAGDAWGLLYFGLSAIPKGAVVSSAKLYLYSRTSAQAGTMTLSLKRLAQAMSSSKVTWNTRPTTLYPDAAKTVSRTGPIAQGAEWLVDVTSQVQSVANGDVWYGWQLTGNFNPLLWFYDSTATDPTLRPRLELAWSVPPSAPTALRPGGGRVVSLAAPTVAATYTDVGNDNALAAVQVQTNSSNLWTSPAWDSGAVTASAPELDLSTQGTFVGLADGETRWWRMRCTDTNGLVSAWSQAESFTRDIKGTVAITSPGVAPNNFVNEQTPPIVWSFTGETQKAYQVNISDPVTGAIIWSSGKVTGTATSLTLPAAALPSAAGTIYNVRVIVWDSKNRETIPNDPAWADASRDFSFVLSNLTTPTTNLVLTPGDPRPQVTLAWSRATFPDSFSIMRNNVVIVSGILPGDVGSGTQFSYIDRSAPPGNSLTYQVLAVVNGKASSGNSTGTVTVRSQGIWLSDYLRQNEVVLFGRETRDWIYGEDSEVLTALNSSESTVVTHSLRGLEGTVQGTLQATAPIGLATTAQQQQAAILTIRAKPGQQCWLTLSDATIPVVIRNLKCAPRPLPTPVYDVSFEFYQVGIK